MKKAAGGGHILPEKMKFEMISGVAFVKLKDAAKLAGIHPVVLEMGQRLLKKVDGEGAIFALGTAELQKHAEAIEAMIKAGLRKISKVFGPGGLAVKSVRDGERLVFWYRTGGSGIKKAAA
ncbi:MAG: hypothetical protein ACREIB_05835 [Pseudomonadota bacterium]